MAIQTSENLNYVLDEVVSAVVFESFYDSTEFLMPQLYNVRPTAKRRERMASFGGLGRFNQKQSTHSAEEDSISQQYEKDFVPLAYAKTVPIERELIDDEEWGVVEDISRQMGIAAGQTMEEDAASLFNNAFSGAGGYAAEDGLSICNGAHLNAQGGNSQSNSGSNSLSMGGIKTTRTAMRKFTNYRGSKITVRPDLLLVSVDQEEDAWEIVRSAGRPDQMNRADNMYNGMFRLAVWDFLTDTNAWFMIDSRLMALNLMWLQRISLESYGDGNLFTGVRSIGAYYRAAHGCRDWRWIYGNNPS